MTETTLVTIIEKSALKKDQLFTKCKYRYGMRSFNAGLLLTLGTLIGVATGDKISHVHPDLAKFVYAFVFSWGLVMIVFMNAELATSNMMYLTASVHRRVLTLPRAFRILLYCTFMNLIGAVCFSFVTSKTGTFAHPNEFMLSVVEAKLNKPSLQIFYEAILANVVVNIAIVGFLRMKNEMAKLTYIVGVIFMFAFLGYEHVIANFSSFSLAYFTSETAVAGMTLMNVLRQWSVAFVGNVIGGGVVIGMMYAWLNSIDADYID